MIGKRTALVAMALVAAAPAHAAVVISTAATQNMNCSDGTCVPTAAKAVLNASDLQGFLSEFGHLEVTTTGSGVEANDIVVKAPFSTPDTTSLTLDAHKAITINAAVSIGPVPAELELQSDTLDATDVLSFGPKGHITFDSLSDVFGINGGVFTLVGSVQGLASAVAANPSGFYALANGYDAGLDGTYTTSPVSTEFAGIFEALGNRISNLRMKVSSDGTAGLFRSVDTEGVLADVELTNAIVGGPYDAAVVVEANGGTLVRTFSTGRVTGGHGHVAGGLVADNAGVIIDSWSSAAVRVRGNGGAAGGLAGENADGGGIANSFATGAVTVADGGLGGGLVGENLNLISNSYATGTVTGSGQVGSTGGFVGNNFGTVSKSYSTGTPSGGSNVYVGGFIGNNVDSATKTYWDTTTSGTDVGVGAGNSSGVTGLTTQQLQSGLPDGFHPKVWAENPNINNGFPYLIANPPPQ